MVGARATLVRCERRQAQIEEGRQQMECGRIGFSRIAAAWPVDARAGLNYTVTLCHNNNKKSRTIQSQSDV